jgi:hypothetical protein
MPVYVISMAVKAMFTVAVGFWDENQVLMPSFFLNEYISFLNFNCIL